MTNSSSVPRVDETTPDVGTSDLDERELIRRAQERDEEASRELVRRYYDGVYRLAYRFLTNAEDAKDVAQDAFLRAFGAIDRFDLDYRFKPWLNRIAMNLITDAIRGRYRTKDTMVDMEPELLPADSDPTARPVAEEESVLVHRVVDSLPPKYRTVLTLRDLEDYDMADIASMLNCPQATVRWRLHQARKMFKQKWERMRP